MKMHGRLQRSIRVNNFAAALLVQEYPANDGRVLYRFDIALNTSGQQMDTGF